MHFETYESADAPPARRFCCTLRMPGNPHMLTFVFGADRAEAEGKARSWIEKHPLPKREKPAPKAKAPTPAPETDDIEEPI